MVAMHYLGAALVLLIITAVGIYSGKQVKSAKDFSSGGRKTGVGVVAGAMIGSLVGGASTIGTAQLAFSYGFSAWWFTLGGGLGCLVLGLFYAKPLHDSGITTLPQVFEREYGRTASTAATLLTSIGNFLTVVSQVLSGVALITAISPVDPMAAAWATVALMLVYVVFGGVWAAGYVGIAKTVLLYVGVGACGIIAVATQGGLGAFREALPAAQYFSLVARGAPVDIGAGISLIVGVLTTQAYIQVVISAKTLRISRIGVFLCALIVPLIGIAGIFVGMYMKLNHPEINPAAALPIFVLENVAPFAAGIILATLLVTVVGTGAGISLGISSMICSDIYKAYIDKDASDKRTLFVSRMIIVIVLIGTVFLTWGNMGTMILGWGYLSMGLRGAVAFGPLCAALFLPGRIPPRYVVAAMIAGPVLVLSSRIWSAIPVDPMFFGLGGSIVILIAGYAARSRERARER